jgi:hypothetical protein
VRTEFLRKVVFPGAFALVLVLSMAMCVARNEGKSTPPDPLFESEYVAKQKLKDVLRDPASASYRNVFAYKYRDAYVFCGEINANNGFGGKSGFVPFFASYTDAYIADDASKMAGYAELSDAFCSPAALSRPVDF